MSRSQQALFPGRLPLPRSPPLFYLAPCGHPPGSRCVTHRCCVRRIGEGPPPGRHSEGLDFKISSLKKVRALCSLVRCFKPARMNRGAGCAARSPRGLSPPPLSPRPPRRVPALFPPARLIVVRIFQLHSHRGSRGVRHVMRHGASWRTSPRTPATFPHPFCAFFKPDLRTVGAARWSRERWAGFW